MRYPDFLRHIVNAKLSEHMKKIKNLTSIVDEVRKLVSSAEAKYGFSSFGGNPEKLADYLLSKDFDLVIQAFKAVNGLDTLVDILNETKNKYNDLPIVVDAINKVLEKISGIKKELSTVQKTNLVRDVGEYVREKISSILSNADVNIRENDIIIRINNTASLLIKPIKHDEIEIHLSVTKTLQKNKLEKLVEKINEIINL
ncbi:MAG: hypothetical protein J7L82_02415 [Staphylothermus sp.]|nr:hypothetical protein [Staphylothermus sp.]